MKPLKQDLEERGFLHQYTHEVVFEKFNVGWQSFYLGVDLSADSMTIGNFVALMMAVHFMLRGNKAYLLVWWATSTLWNPAGKDAERPILEEKQLLINQAGITNQFSTLIHNVEKISWKKLDFEIVNNYDFFKEMNVLDFMKEVGRFMTVNWMIGKEIVKKRITDPDKWISYAEFSYMLIMWYDFFHLWKTNWVTLEIGWSDEWDGILSWVELVSKKEGWEVYGVTNKLITDANGKKFGKSEWNALWLDTKKTSSYTLYQYFMNTLDVDIRKYLGLFTFMDIVEIEKIVHEHNAAPERRVWQSLLAYKVVEMVHWTHEAETSAKISKLLFGEGDRMEILKNLEPAELTSFYTEIWWFHYTWENLFETLVKAGLASSNSEARKSLESGAIFINEEKISDMNCTVGEKFINDTVLLIRKWKKSFKLITK